MRVSPLFFATIVATAQTQTIPPPAPAPSFRIGTKLVEVDVVAVVTAKDKNGPAAGLTKTDFTLLDNGKPQEIAVFSVKASQPAGRPKSPLPLGIVSNRVNRDGETLGSGTVVLLDQQNLPVNRQADAIGEIVRFVAGRRKQDRIGIYSLQKDGLLLVQDLTDNDELLRRAAQSLKPVAPQTCDSAGEDCPLRLALETKHAFEAIARHLANVPGRKSAIWITASFPLIINTPRVQYNFTEDMQAAARALSDAHIALYSVTVRGLTVGGRGIYPPGFNTMDLMAELTGGEVFINTNDIKGSIETAAEEGDLVYTLGFYPSQDEKAQDEKDGTSHKLKIEVARKGLSLRYRESYVAGKPQVAVDPKAMQQLLESSLDASQIELAAQAIPDNAHPGTYRVVVSVSLHDVQFQHEGPLWAGDLDVAYMVEGTEGFRVIKKKIEFHDDKFAAGVERGTLIEASITPEPAKGILRIAVQDQVTGAAGSVKVPFGKK